MSLLLPLFSRVSSSVSFASHILPKRAFSSTSKPLLAPSNNGFLFPPQLPPNITLSHAKTVGAAKQRQELSVLWFKEGYCPSEIATALSPGKPGNAYSLWTIRLYLVKHARDSILFRTTLQFGQALSATSVLRGKVQLNRLRLFDEGRFALLPVCELWFQTGMKMTKIAKKMRVRLDTVRTFILTLALLDPTMRSLVESKLRLLFAAERGRFVGCSTFEEGCEAMKEYQDGRCSISVFDDENVKQYELGIRIGGRLKGKRAGGDVIWEEGHSNRSL